MNNKVKNAIAFLIVLAAAFLVLWIVRSLIGDM